MKSTIPLIARISHAPKKQCYERTSCMSLSLFILNFVVYYTLIAKNSAYMLYHNFPSYCRKIHVNMKCCLIFPDHTLF